MSKAGVPAWGQVHGYLAEIDDPALLQFGGARGDRDYSDLPAGDPGHLVIKAYLAGLRTAQRLEGVK